MNTTAPATRDGPLHARFDGPIVMVGFGSIGKGTLPLIERHMDFDREKFVVIAPDDDDRSLLDERQIRFIHEGLTRENYRDVLTPLLTRDLVGSLVQDPHTRKPVHQLTERQREVLQLLAEGRSMKEAAAILNVSARTVAFHKYRMMEHLHVTSTAALIQFAVREGLV